MNSEQILSNRGGILRCVDSYIHRKKRVYNDTTYWVCVEPNCREKLTTINGEIVSGPKDHHHEPSLHQIISRKQRNMVKKGTSDNPSRKCREIYDDVNSNLIHNLPFNDDLIGTNLQTFDSLKPTMYRVKRARYPPLPTTLTALSVPESLQFTKKSEKFLLHDNKDLTSRIVIFATSSFLKFLCEEKRVYADGTFKCVPNLFNSLYTFHVMREGVMITCVYCLLTNRTSITYINALRIIQDLCREQDLVFNPESITMDFEQAMIRAINMLLPNTKVVGCLFHFSQCLRRKVQEIGLSRQYSENDGDNEIQKTIRRVAALAFMKLDDIDEAFTEVVQNMPDNSLLDEFMSYFYDNFFKSNSRFNRAMWNHFLNDGPRTNNHVEGWHNSFNQRIARHHANIWYFLEKMVDQQEIFENNLLIARQGKQINQRNRKNILIGKRIMIQKAKYERDEITKLEFLDSIRYNFSI